LKYFPQYDFFPIFNKLVGCYAGLVNLYANTTRYTYTHR
jgi:hypothetical protein